MPILVLAKKHLSSLCNVSSESDAGDSGGGIEGRTSNERRSWSIPL